MKENAIRVSEVGKSFKGKEILQKINFEIQKGSIVGLLGPNGSGKTTMIRLMNGLLKPDCGEIEIMGMNPVTKGEEIRKISGVIAETTNLYHELTAWENIIFFGKLYGTEDVERAEDLFKIFDMWKFRNEKIGSFSTGMKKRVLLVKALLNRPQILFLDEPTNGLDPEGIHLVLNYIKKINQKEDVTVFVCSHVLQQLEDICQSYLFIKGGHLIATGTKRQLEEKYIRSYRVEIEAKSELKTKHQYEKISENQYLFQIEDKNRIDALLKSLVLENEIYSCKIKNNDLDSLYFSITEGDKK